VRVLVVDDSDVFRNVLRAVVTATPAFEVVGAASSGREALDMVDRLVPELVLADVAMPELDGTETARLIRRRYPEIVVVLLSAFSRASAKDPELSVVDKRDLSPRWLADFWATRGGSSSSVGAPTA